MRMEGELAKAKALLANAEAKKQRRVFLDSIMAKRSEMMKARTAHKKLRVELGKELKQRCGHSKKRQSAGRAELERSGQGTPCGGTPVGHE